MRYKLLVLIIIILYSCAKSNKDFIFQKPVEPIRYNPNCSLKVRNVVLETIPNIAFNKNYIFDKKDIKWCSVPVPASVPKQSQTHPSIIYVKNKWKGYTHWLGTTPYPNADIAYENPCIYFSNQIGLYTAPTVFNGIPKNPISIRPEGTLAHNSDIELILSNDTLYSINRECFNSKYAREVEIQKSADGLNWSKPKHLYSDNDVSGKELLSPAIIYKDKKFYIYHLNGDAGNSYTGKCTSMEIMQGTSLSKPDFKYFKKGNFINKDVLKIEPWHMDLFEYYNKLFMVFCGRKVDKPTIQYTYLAVSDDYINFTIFEKPIISNFDSYRPTAYVDENGIFTLYFSVVGNYVGDGSDRAIGVAQIPMDQLLGYLSQ